MRRLSLLLSCISCSPQAYQWHARDTALQASFAASLALDYAQTRRITRDCMEANPIMGRCGERLAPEIYFPATFVMHTVWLIVIPNPYRNMIQGFSLGISVRGIQRNWEAGYTVEW